MNMTARARDLGQAPAQPVPMPMSRDLLRQALEGARRLHPNAPNPTLTAWVWLCQALSEALLEQARALSGSLYTGEAGAPHVPGGERRKKYVKAGTPEHVARIAKPFEKMLTDTRAREQLAREILAGRVPVAL